MAAYAGIRRGTSVWEKKIRKPCHNMKAFYERGSDYIRMEEASFTT